MIDFLVRICRQLLILLAIHRLRIHSKLFFHPAIDPLKQYLLYIPNSQVNGAT